MQGSKEYAGTTDKTCDLLDELRSEWAVERPDLDTAAMGIIGRIMRLGRAFEADAETSVRPHGIRYTDFDILATLRRSGSPYQLKPSRLCEAVLLTSGAMTAALDRLETLQLITRQSDPDDRRVRAAALTTKGINVAEHAAEDRFRVARDAASALSNKEFETLENLLRKLS